MKYRDFYMDTDILDRALNSCDLGDGYSAQVRQYPHKDHIKYYTRVIEHQAYTDLKQQADMLKKDLYLLQAAMSALMLSHNLENKINEAFKYLIDRSDKDLKTYESFIRESEE